MKTSTKITKNTWLVSMFILSFFVAAEAKAHWKKPYVPVAICSTGGTNIPYPYYVCCKKMDIHGNGWKNQWVPTDCKNADVNATYALGCTVNSKVYQTGAPIIGNCQFSFSTKEFSYCD